MTVLQFVKHEPGFTKYIEHFRDKNGYVYCVQECYQQSLYNYMQSQKIEESGKTDKYESYVPMTLKQIQKIMLQILTPLVHLHTNGIAHRDLKPENILMDKEDNLYIGDFGFAQLNARRTETNVSIRQGATGTPGYMSIEATIGTGSNVFANDMWAVGIIFAELLVSHQLNYCHKSNNI